MRSAEGATLFRAHTKGEFIFCGNSMSHSEIVLRKEAFGGILGKRDGYGFHALNHAGYELLSKSTTNQPINSENNHFANQLRELGLLSDDGVYRGSVVDNGNAVSYLSAPIRVWLEVTGRCNLSCRECFNDNHQGFKENLSLSEIKAILDDLYQSGVLQLTITGGEPLLRKDIWDILDYAFELGFGVRFFTNGTTLNEANSKRLANYPIAHIFVSLDGIGATNDALRGQGSSDKISQGIVNLAKKNSNVTLSVTLHSQSLGNLTRIFDFAKENGIRSLLIRPLSQYTEIANPLAINKLSLPVFLDALENESRRTGVEYQLNKLPFFQNTKSVFVYDRPSDVHFSYFSEHNQFGCVGGNTVVGIKSNGTIMACGFVAHKYEAVGNRMIERKFLDLWNTSNNVTVLRDRVGNENCNKCPLLSVCGGGCRANALLHNGSLDAVDPYCFWGNPTLLPPLVPDLHEQEQELTQLHAVTPFVSKRTIVTKCGSGTML